MKDWESELQVLGQCVVAILLGGVLGWERERAGKWAGLRTHMLVCVAAMLYVRVGQFLILDAEETFQPGNLRTDPSVMIAKPSSRALPLLERGPFFAEARPNLTA